MKSKYKKIADRVIMIGFILTILSGIVIGINSEVKYGQFIGLKFLVLSILLLGTYILTEKVFIQKFSFIPTSFYYIAVVFAFFATYLGSILNFYERFAWWDDVLHFTSGILLGMLTIIVTSFLVIKRFGTLHRKKDIIVMVVIGVMASISIAVFWEFYEFSYDYFFDGNMQRSIIIDDPASFDVTMYMRPSGRFVDPGLVDTMGDFFQAVCGSIIAGIYCATHYILITKNITNYSKTNNIEIEEYKKGIN